MKELGVNELKALEILKEMGKDGNPIETSLRTLKLPIIRKRWTREWRLEPGVASHQTVKEILKRLQAKGHITLDYSNKQNPKIIVNI